MAGAAGDLDIGPRTARQYLRQLREENLARMKETKKQIDDLLNEDWI